ALRAGDTAGLPDALTVARNQPQGLDKLLLDAVLGADPARLPSVMGIDLGAQGYAVLRVTQVLPPAPLPGGDAEFVKQYAQAWADAEAQAYIDALKQRYKVQILPAAKSVLEASTAPSP
ncbi:MAG: peptidyl-prolyl cis-trans isomerase, partial [Burkholderiales bacterium]|nr:peptidyl-prolyl cis-trans isomerase [Burkholderiales bacterium]